MLVFGTRPEAIKMAPLVKELKKRATEFETIVCVTGQHREMLDQVLEIFDIHPDYDLNIMKQGQDLYDITARVLVGMRDILKEVQPDVVLVHGDTTTSTAAALAAFYQQIPVGHVEAGLRTYDIYSPWPEEMNRQITGRIATYNFAPTPLSKEHLLKENISNDKIVVTGNTVIDALYWVVNKIKHDIVLEKELKGILAKAGYDTERLKAGKKLVLITGHRRENFGKGFINICTAIRDLKNKYPNVDFVYPMHLNPNVRKPIYQIFGDDLSNLDNMFFIGGISNEEKKLDYVQNTICPKCGKFSRMEVYMTYMYFSLFFVPIFKWSKKYFVKYTCCNSIYILDEDIGIKINHKENISISDDNLHYVDNDFSTFNRCNNCDYICEHDFEYCPKCGKKL